METILCFKKYGISVFGTTVADLDKMKFIFQNFRKKNARPPKILGGRAKFNAAA